jgi:excisionase family DNA binding protein
MDKLRPSKAAALSRDPDDLEGRPSSGPSRRRRPRAFAVEPLLLRDEETAVMLGVSRRTVNSLASSGRLIAIHPPGMRARRFARTDVEALADQWIRDGKGETSAK